MTIMAVFLAGVLLSAPEATPTVPDYFDGKTEPASPAIVLCNLNGEETSGPFKTCRYDCGRTLTVGERSVCPFILQQ